MNLGEGNNYHGPHQPVVGELAIWAASEEARDPEVVMVHLGGNMLYKK